MPRGLEIPAWKTNRSKVGSGSRSTVQGQQQRMLSHTAGPGKEKVCHWARNSPCLWFFTSVAPQATSLTDTSDWSILRASRQNWKSYLVFSSFSKWERLCQVSQIDKFHIRGKRIPKLGSSPKLTNIFNKRLSLNFLLKCDISVYKVRCVPTINSSHTDSKTHGKSSWNSDMKLNTVYKREVEKITGLSRWPKSQAVEASSFWLSGRWRCNLIRLVLRLGSGRLDLGHLDFIKNAFELNRKQVWEIRLKVKKRLVPQCFSSSSFYIEYYSQLSQTATVWEASELVFLANQPSSTLISKLNSSVPPSRLS